jgi:hypothetical protein
MGSCSPKANEDYGTLFFSQGYQIILPFPLKVAMVRESGLGVNSFDFHNR